ncbi:hypothetical protein [Mycobacterium lepromatosis]|uniref:hypothetical protein n=1 Tax=Mycobacterium lepromatosis TaxID=480418 RepID=UPI0012E0264B|nr:hypothetical protein [Mycobacterium lepromatosis]
MIMPVMTGMMDFSVNVRSSQPPEWLVQRLAEQLWVWPATLVSTMCTRSKTRLPTVINEPVMRCCRWPRRRQRSCCGPTQASAGLVMDAVAEESEVPTRPWH